MPGDPPSRRQFPAIPPEYVLDALTRYIYRHFSSLLTEEERAAERVLTGRLKHMFESEPISSRALEIFHVPEVEAKFPELMHRIDQHGLASVMRAAANRVLRENPDKQILHTCAKCGELCQTPRALQCFACGFDWHPSEVTPKPSGT